MTILSCTFKDSGARVDNTGKRSYTRTYLVSCDDQTTDDEAAVLDADDLPRRLDPHPSDDSMRASTFDVKRHEDRLHWMIEVGYEKYGGTAAQNGGTDPWDLPAKVKFSGNIINRAMKCAYDQDNDTRAEPTVPIVNSAGDVFVDPVMKDIHNLVITITRAERNFDPDTILDFVDTINEAEITVGGKTIPKWCGLMKDITADPEWTQEDEQYYNVTYTIEVDPLTWQLQIFSMGYNEYIIGTGKGKIQIDGADAREPQALDEDGKYFDVKAEPAKAFYCKFNKYWDMVWTPLELPAEVDGRR